MNCKLLAAALLIPLSISVAAPATAGPLRDRILARRAQVQAGPTNEDASLAGEGRGAVTAVPPGVSVQHDVAYGETPTERFDVYTPLAGAHDAPVIFMVHGGGWSRGDKNMKSVVENKAARWVPRGFILVSVDYPMLPAANPLQQANAVAKALAAAQRQASTWGGNPAHFIVMGHSAGAHLISLISSSKSIVAANNVRPWLGSIALDSAAYDVETIMSQHHLSLYDQAFGSDHALWRDASPLLQLSGQTSPFLAVCSSRRRESCAQAKTYVNKTKSYGTMAEVLPEDLSHMEINADLGATNAYTDAVESFMRTLGPSIRARLQ